MATRDLIHDAVKNALIKDGWTILADPYQIRYEDKLVAADLRAEKLLRLSRDNETIVVEIKSFIGHSFIKDLQAALGQYQMYSFFLQALGTEETIYMAISEIVYQEKFHSKAVQQLVAHFNVRLLVVDIQTEELVQWIK